MADIKLINPKNAFLCVLKEPRFDTIKLWYDDFTGEFYPAMPPILSRRIHTSFNLHFVLDGEGYFAVGDKEPTLLKKGDAFFIYPNRLMAYYPNPENPWKYCGISISGKEGAALCKTLGINDSVAIKPSKTIDLLTSEVIKAINTYKKGSSRYALLSSIYNMMSILEDSTKAQPNITSPALNYVRNAEEYLKEHYSEPSLRIPDVAAALNLSHSYLCRIFKELTGYSAEQYLLNHRMTVAAKLLTETDYPVGEIAFLSGYTDPAHFSKIYKRHFGKSPKFTR